MSTAFLTHPDCAAHEMGSHHPESPARVRAIEQALNASGLMSRLQRIEAPAASIEQIERAHSSGYVESIEAAAPDSGLTYLDPDTAMNRHTLSAALHAAGAVVYAVDQVIAGTVSNAFCSVRPPGHHACHGRAMGFCVFNNVAIGALHALEAHGLERVAIIDFDVHHGNGTEDILGDDPRVLMVGSFQHPFYPGSGVNPRGANMLNVPLAAGTGSAAFRAMVEQVWVPAIDAFGPQLILISAGFDAHRDDTLASLALEDEDYTWVSQRIVDMAAKHARGRIVSSLEGGYELAALARCVHRHIAVLAGV